MREIMGLIYIFRFIICGVAIGLILIRLNVFTSFSRRKTFCIGVCSTPMFLSLFDYLLALIWRGIPSIFLTLGIPLVSVGFCLMNKNRVILHELFRMVKANTRQCWFKDSNKYWTLVCITTLLMFLTCLILAISSKVEWLSHVVQAYATRSENNQCWAVGVIMFVAGLALCMWCFGGKKKIHGNRADLLCKYLVFWGAGLIVCMITAYAFLKTNADVYEWDRSHYELQARYFAETREASEIDNYHDEKYGTVFMDDHGPLWPVYIADARMCAGKYDDYFNPLTIDLAYFMVVMCYLGMVVITAWIITDNIMYGLSALLVLCMDPYAYWYYIVGSRDSFRVIGILLLSLFVLEIYNRLYTRVNCKERCLKKGESLFLALLCYLCMQGHGGNAYIMLGLFIVFGCMVLLEKVNISELIKMAVSVLAGTLLGMAKTILIYLKTGRISSNTVLVFEGTDAAMRYQESRQQAWTWKAALENYWFVDWYIIILGIVGIIISIYTLKKFKRTNIYIKLSLFAVLVLGLMLPLSGIMNFIGYNIALSYIKQMRYRLYFLVLLSIMGAGSAKIYAKNNSYLKCAGVFLIIILSFNSSIIQFKNLDVTEDNSVTGSWREFAERLEELAGDGEIYVDHEVFAYYFHKNPKLLYHPISRELMIAKTEDEVENAIKELNISVITFHPSLGRYDYSVLPLYSYLENSPNVEKITLKASNDSNLPLYLIK